MSDAMIACPQCRTQFALTESLAAPLVAATRAQYEQKLAGRDAEVARREAIVRAKETQLACARDTLEQQVAERVGVETAKLAAEEARKAKAAAALELTIKARELAEVQEILHVQERKLAEAQMAQAELVRKQRELDDARRELELTVERRIQTGLETVREQAKREAEDALKLRVLERDRTIASMQQTIEELKRKSEQGSQQLQGEVQELALESMLRREFPIDTLGPVPKGEFGGDLVHTVLGQSGQRCGTLLWECKRTKSWSDGWLAKLRDDQRAARADVAIIVSQALPKGVDTCALLDGVWVVSPKAAVAIATALRQSLIDVCNARAAADGLQTKAEIVYQYLTGPRFQQRVEAIVEAFVSMQSDLARERRAMEKLWSKREEQIERVMRATTGMYGDLQGFAGTSMRDLPSLALEAPTPLLSAERVA